MIENRDHVFSIGGASGAFTIANVLAKYNANLQGAFAPFTVFYFVLTVTTGAALSWTKPLAKGGWLDAGVSMAKVEDCPSQVDYLVKELKTTYALHVDFEKDWKLLTLFIGANNICGMAVSLFGLSRGCLCNS